MCDTTSSVLNDHPPVVSDSESWALSDVRSEQDKAEECDTDASEDQGILGTRDAKVSSRNVEADMDRVLFSLLYKCQMSIYQVT